MDLLALATTLLQNKLGGNIQQDSISKALSGLLGINGGGIDLSSLIGSMMTNNGLQSLALSWLGDGQNQAISSAEIGQIFGADKLSKFASELGVSRSSAQEGLADVLPQIVNTSSSGGSLLESAGGMGGLMSIAKKLF